MISSFIFWGNRQQWLSYLQHTPFQPDVLLSRSAEVDSYLEKEFQFFSNVFIWSTLLKLPRNVSWFFLKKHMHCALFAVAHKCFLHNNGKNWTTYYILFLLGKAWLTFVVSILVIFLTGADGFEIYSVCALMAHNFKMTSASSCSATIYIRWAWSAQTRNCEFGSKKAVLHEKLGCVDL